MATLREFNDQELRVEPTPRKTSKTDFALDVADLVLSALKKAAKYSNFPYVRDAAEYAIEIVQIVQDVRGNKNGLKLLAKDAADLVYAVLMTVDGREALDDDLNSNLRQLIRKLIEIQQFAKKDLSRSAFIRTIKHKSDQDLIKEYRQSLHQSLEVFGLQSSIIIQGKVTQIQEGLQTMNERDKKRDEAEKERLAQEADALEEVRAAEALESFRLEKSRKDELLKIEIERIRRDEEEELNEKAKREADVLRLAAAAAAAQRLEDERRRKEAKEAKEAKEKYEEEQERRSKAEEIRRQIEALELAKARRAKEEEERALEEKLERLRLEAEEAGRPSSSAWHAPQSSAPASPPFFPPSSQGSYGGSFPFGFQPNYGGVQMNNVHGVNNMYNGSVFNHNSGNTNTNIITNSGNDSSIRIGGKSRRRS